MPIRITLGSEVIEVDTSLEDWNRASRRALEANTMVEIQEPSGRILSINPRRVDLVEAMESPPSAPPEQSAPEESQQAQVA
jgi:hypothetical protein